MAHGGKIRVSARKFASTCQRLCFTYTQTATNCPTAMPCGYPLMASAIVATQVKYARSRRLQWRGT